MSGDEYLREQEERLAAMAREEAVARFEQQEQEREEQALVLSKEALDAHNKQMQPSESAGRLEHAHANAPARTLSHYSSSQRGAYPSSDNGSTATGTTQTTSMSLRGGNREAANNPDVTTLYKWSWEQPGYLNPDHFDKDPLATGAQHTRTRTRHDDGGDDGDGGNGSMRDRDYSPTRDRSRQPYVQSAWGLRSPTCSRLCRVVEQHVAMVSGLLAHPPPG